MFEITPVIIGLTIILAAIIGGVVGSLISKAKSNNIESSSSTHTFHIDSNTGIVSDIT